MSQIGTVEIVNAARVYEIPDGRMATVETGTPFPLYFDGMHYYWKMTGHVTDSREPQFKRLGDSTFIIRPGGDELTDEQVTFLSRAFTRDEWRDELLSHPIAQDGPAKRLNIQIWDAAPSDV